MTVMANEEAARKLHDDVLAALPPGKHNAAECPFCSPGHRETASEGVPVAEPTNSTVDLNDPAIKAIVDSRVDTATTDLRERAEKAEAERDEKQTRIDVLEAEKATAEQAATTAKEELDSFKAEVDGERASASRRDSRKAQLVEKVPHLTDDWFNAEVEKASDDHPAVTRLDRMAKMEDSAFENYATEIAAAFEGIQVTPAKGDKSKSGDTTPPRETAMAGQTTGGDTGKSASSSWIGGVSLTGRR